MNRTRLKNKFNKLPNKENEENFRKQKNYCTNLVKRE